MFCSYSFLGDSTPADIDAEALYRHHPLVCAGIVLFDILVINCDRHGGNLKVDRPNAPTRVHIFDHERALFHVIPKQGIRRLDERTNRLGLTDGVNSHDESHCLIPQLKTLEHIREWVSRIESIPNWLLTELGDEVRPFGVTNAESARVVEFLKDRKVRFSELLSAHKDRFPGIPKNDWGMFI